jgi:hypothetical protein
MKISENMKDALETKAKVSIRCFFMNYALILLWWASYMIGRRCKLHKLIFNLNQHEFALVTYCGIAFAKVCNVMFFLFPYIAIRWVLKTIKS